MSTAGTATNNSVKRKEKPRNTRRHIDDLILPASKLKFTGAQLQNLNYLFHKQLADKERDIHLENDKSIILARSVTERLVQRLVCCAGLIDERFTSKYLIPLHKNHEIPTHLQYLIRLDKLSRALLYKNDTLAKYSIIENDAETPNGYARVRMFSALYKTWSEFANNQRYLRRDKIQAKYVELLAQAASSDVPSSPTDLDESKYCASPSKIIDAFTLQNILKIPAEEHVYFGANGKNPRFPDPRDFRLAIVDEPSGIRLRVEFISPALSSLSIDVRILLAIELEDWPATANFPERVPLGHTDCLLYQQAVQTGVYLVGYGVQSSAWQMRVPAAEIMLFDNYGPNSTVHNILNTACIILDHLYKDSGQLQRKFQMNSCNILNGYILKTVLFFELEKDVSAPTMALLNWSPHTLSRHVLKIFDNLITALRNEKLPNYFFTATNLLANPGHLCEDDYMIEARNVQRLILKLYDQSLMSNHGDAGFDNMVLSQDFELLLLTKWKELIHGLIPPAATRARRFCFAGGGGSRKEVAHSQYTPRQLEYIGLLLKNVLKVRQIIIQPLDDTWEDYPPEKLDTDDNIMASSVTEDIIYILLMIIEQAKHIYLSSVNDKIKTKLLNSSQFDASILKLVDMVRKDHQVIVNDFEFVTCVLKWLYRALDQNHKLLAPILRPYLSMMFISSHGISWFLDDIKKRLTCSDEMMALGVFAKLVNDRSITPAEGLIDCVNKNWRWAKDMLQFVEKDHLRVIFIRDREQIGRHILYATAQNRKKQNAAAMMAHTTEEGQTFSTLPKNSYFGSMVRNTNANQDEDTTPIHCALRDASPMSLIIHRVAHRRGDHRCAGDILQTLISMQKQNILQEMSAILPAEDRLLLLESVQKLTNHKKKNTIKKSVCPVYSASGQQKYTKKEESAGAVIQKVELVLSKSDLNENLADSLMDNCRVARILQTDLTHSTDTLKIMAKLVKSKESFRN